MHQRFRQPRLSRVAARPAAPSHRTPTRPPAARPAGRPAAAASSAYGPRVGRCRSARPAGPPAAVQPATILARGRLAVHRSLQPGRDRAHADPGHGGRVDLQRGPDGGVGPARAGLAWLAFTRMRAWVRALAGATPRPIMVCSRARSCSDRTTMCRLRTSASCGSGFPGPHEHETEPYIPQLTTDEPLGAEAFVVADERDEGVGPAIRFARLSVV